MLRAKLFRNGSSQAVRLPKEYRFAGTEVYVQPMGRGILLLPVGDTWDVLRRSLDRFTDDFMADRQQAAPQTRSPLE